MEFSATTEYVQVGGPYHKILHGLCWRRNGPHTKIKNLEEEWATYEDKKLWSFKQEEEG